MARFDHRRSRPLHDFRHGWTHYRQHRDGVRHGHSHQRRHSTAKPVATPAEALRKGRHWLRSPWPTELLKQVAIGFGLAVGFVLVVCVVWGTITILEARNDLRGAQSEATSLAVDRTQLFTKSGRARAAREVLAMEHHTTSAANLVDGSIPLHVLSWIPFVGQQVDGVTSLVNDFQTTAYQADQLLTDTNLVLDASHGTSVSLPALAILRAQVGISVATLRPLDRGSGLLIGPIASARTTFDHEIVEITRLLTDGENLLGYAGPFLGSDGPRTYLLAGENNAEMRDQGAVLSWSIITADNGTFRMEHPESVGELKLRYPATVPLPRGTLEAFGALNPTQVWQSVNATADFPLSGETMAAMYEQRTHQLIDGVIAVDVPALENVLKATGPVHANGIPVKVSSKNAAWVLLHQLYWWYPHNYQLGTRHDEVSAVATAAVQYMERHPHAVDLAFLVDQLAKATAGRHLLVWSRFPALEQAVTRFGASGSLTADGTDVIHLATESAVAAKLDWYVHTAAIYHVDVDSNGTAYITAKIVIANTAPVHGPHYVLGPDHINSFTIGQYVGRLDLWFPRGSVSPDGLPESGLVLARAEIDVLAGHKETLLLYDDVPHAVRDGRFQLQFIPQSTIWPQVVKVVFDAPGWSSSGPRTTVFTLRGDRTLRWQLSR